MTGLGGPDPLGELAEGIARAALAVPGVAALSGGAFGAVATSLPGRRVVGVALRETSGEVAFVGELGYDLRAVAEANGLLAGIPGYGEGWNPWAPATRGEVAQLLFNTLTLDRQ